MPIKLNSTAGGSVTLTTPLTGTDYTLTVPANNGTIMSAASSVPSGYIPFGTGTGLLSSSSSLYWDSANSRLGVGTSSPSYRFQVTPADSGSIGMFIGDGNSGNFYDGVHVQGAADGSVGGFTAFSRLDVANTTINYVNLSYTTNLGLGLLMTGNALAFQTGQTLRSNGYDSTKTRMLIDSSGNVGIGTASPSTTLDVSAAAASFQVSSTTGTNRVFSRTVNGSGNFYFGIDSSTGGLFGNGNYSRNIYSDGAYPMVFVTNSVERMRIDSSGRVTMPYQPAVLATRTTHVTTTLSPIIFDNIVNQTGSNYNASTGYFTCPVSGWYFVSFSALLYNMGSASYAYYARNGGQVGPSTILYGQFTGSYAIQGAAHLLYCNTNDTLSIGFVNNGTYLHSGYIGLSITLIS